MSAHGTSPSDGEEGEEGLSDSVSMPPSAQDSLDQESGDSAYSESASQSGEDSSDSIHSTMTDELSSSSPRRSRRRHAPDQAWAARLTAQLPTPTPLPSDAAAGHCMCPAVTIEVEGDGSPEQTAGDGQTVEEGPAEKRHGDCGALYEVHFLIIIIYPARFFFA